MSLFDADMIDIKSQKSAPGDRQFCYKSLRNAIRPLRRHIDTKRAATRSTCGIVRFAAGFVLKPEHKTCNVRGLPKPKVQYFSSGSAILGCDPSGQKWPVGALEIGKVAVAAVRVQFLPIQHRKSGCGCCAVRFFGVPTAKNFCKLLQIFANFCKLQ